MADRDTLAALAEQVGLALSPLQDALASPEAFAAFAVELGWSLDTLPAPVSAIAGPLESLVKLLEAGQVDASTVEGVISAIGGVIGAINALSSQSVAFPAGVDAGVFADELLEFLLVDYLLDQQPQWGRTLRVLGVISVTPVAATGSRPGYTKRSINWSNLGQVFNKPTEVLTDAWAWGSASFDTEGFFNSVGSLVDGVGLVGSAVPVPAAVRTALTGSATPTDQVEDWIWLIPLVGDPSGPAAFNLNLGLYMLPAGGGRPPGFAALVFASGIDVPTLQLTDTLSLGLTTPVDLGNGAAVLMRPGAAPTLQFGILTPGGSAGNALAVVLTSTADQPTVLVGSLDASHLSVNSVSITTGIRLASDNALDFFGELAMQGGQLQIKPGSGEADGFIASILPDGGIQAAFNFGVGLSTKNGFYFSGSSALEIKLPLHVSIGPIDVSAATIALSPAAGALAIDIGATISGALGPLQAEVDNLGLEVRATFPGSGGNLGPVDLSLGFKPPTGVGLSLDLAVISGGGFLDVDYAHGQYSGVLQLDLLDIVTVTAIGLIDTKLPDGSSGFSLLLVLTADFGAGIQLGFGFTLNAVGGLVGLNRSMLFQPLMDAVKSDAIESIMFPQNVIANADRIISDLRSIFPPQDGTFLIGPMAKLGWGEPTLVSVSLGIIIEIPPGDIAILGILELALPADELAILKLQVNFAGALEFDKQRLYFFAELYDSHLLFITIQGGMGLLVAWGDNANFVVSVGGFNPQFNPPPLPFPVPDRVEVDIINESFARIVCQGYFAVTSNTVQFGASSSYYFGFSACNVQGSSSFDALIQFSPFAFSVSISTSFSVSVFGLGLFGIGISLTVDGPTPWHVSGSGSLSFFFFSISIPIDFTWGDSRNTTLPPVDVMPMLDAEFQKRTNWKAVLPSTSNLLVSLRKLDADETDLVLHPVGTLQISQRAVPLDLTISKVGNQSASDANRFSLTAAPGAMAERGELQDSFAPSQYNDFSDAAKLSQPAFQLQDSGIELGAAQGDYASGIAVTRIVRYDLTIIDTELRESRLRLLTASSDLFGHLLAGASVAHSPLSGYVHAQTHPFDGAVDLSAEQYVVAQIATNAALSADASFTSAAAAADHLARAITADPSLSGTLHVLPASEVAA
ncbi:MAG: DUF6603 domain-containing protein [Mycobacterium sp.]